MRWLRCLPLIFLAGPAWGGEGYVISLGAEADNEDAFAASLSADIGINEKTWLSMAVAQNSVDLPRGISIDTLYADIGVDYWFDPVGVRASVAYWGDSDILDSRDYLGAVYWRGDKFMIAGEYEHRDFTFDIFRNNLRPGQDFEFHSNGLGVSARFDLSDNVDLSIAGTDYDYSVNLGIDENRPIADFISVSRLSLINSLIDYRARVGLGVDAGRQRWSFDLATWKGEVDTRKTNSATIRLLTPMGKQSDIEFGLGVDKSRDYGSVTVFSIFLYFYG